MPPKLKPSENYLLDKIAALEKQVSKLAQQQQTTISNSQGQPILNFGLLPALKSSQTTQQYGLQMLAPGTSVPIVQLGQQADGTYGLYIFNPSGAVLMELTGSGLNLLDSAGETLIELTDSGLGLLNSSGSTILELDTIGLTFYDSNGNILVQLNDTGLSVQSGSSSQVIQPIYSVADASTFTTTAATWQNLGFPSVDVPIGASGNALVILSSYAATTVAGTAAYAGLSIDGNAPTSVNLSLTSGDAYLGASTSATFITGALTQATHSFSIWYEAGTAGDTVNFHTGALVVWPL